MDDREKESSYGTKAHQETTKGPTIICFILNFAATLDPLLCCHLHHTDMCLL